MKTAHQAPALLVLFMLTACSKPPEATDPGSMIEPPPLAEITGTDATSRAKAEEVYFRCSQVPRRERHDNPWCRLRDQASACKSGGCTQQSD